MKPALLRYLLNELTVIAGNAQLLSYFLADGTPAAAKFTADGTLIDLTGKVYGKLTVIQKDTTTENGKARWICKCECGSTVSVLSDSLRKGKTKSCGCSQFQLKHDLTGQTFGYLKVIESVKNDRIAGNETRWKCLCQNCGRTVEVSSYWLRHSDPYGHCKCTRFNKPK